MIIAFDFKEKKPRICPGVLKNSKNFCPKCPKNIIKSEGPKHKFYKSGMECYEPSIFFQARAENVCFGFEN